MIFSVYQKKRSNYSEQVQRTYGMIKITINLHHIMAENTGIKVQCEKPLTVLYDRDWMNRLINISGSIVFIDEQSSFVKSVEFAEAIKGSDNYYVIVTREKLSDTYYNFSIYPSLNSSCAILSICPALSFD